MASKWLVINTLPRAEYLAADELGRDGFEVFLPCVKVSDSRDGHVDTPIFPGYLFVRHDSETEGWPTFRAAHRVLGWVKFGGEVPWLPDEIVADLRKRVKDINQAGGVWQQFLPGERVEIVSKSIRTLGEVIDASPSPQGKFKVLIDFMGRQVSAQVPWDIIRPLTSPAQPNPAPRRTRGKGRWIRGHGSRVGTAG